MIVFIDSSVLGILANPNKVGEVRDCWEWIYKLLPKGVYVCSSQICDFEVRRSMILESQLKPSLNHIVNLDQLQEFIPLLPITPELLKKHLCFGLLLVVKVFPQQIIKVLILI